MCEEEAQKAAANIGLVEEALELAVAVLVVDDHVGELLEAAKAAGLDELRETLRRGVHHVNRVRQLLDGAHLFAELLVLGKGVQPAHALRAQHVQLGVQLLLHLDAAQRRRA